MLNVVLIYFDSQNYMLFLPSENDGGTLLLYQVATQTIFRDGPIRKW